MHESATFQDIFASSLRAARLTPRALPEGECQSASSRRCTLCAAVDIEYDQEVAVKERALQSFWKKLDLPTALAPLVRSPLGRGYRTVSKRKAFHDRRGNLNLALIAPSGGGTQVPFPVIGCAIEPAAHRELYGLLGTLLVKPYARPMEDQLSYVILKGNYREFTIILNVREISAEVVRSANTMSKTLTRERNDIAGIFLYEDTSNGRYYLGTRNANVRSRTKKIFGKGTVYAKVLGRSFLSSPLSFSQVNHAMMEPMVNAAGTLLGLSREETLFDLYCGYGLFGLCLAGQARNVVGVEMSPDSIESAIGNAKRQGVTNVRFMRNDITAESMMGVLRTARTASSVLLDPPRGGTAPGVIEQIAGHHPKRVVHIFCNIELIAKDVAAWKASGYVLSKAIPFDMFPGTTSMEIMLLFVPR